MDGMLTSISGFLNVDKPPGWTSSDVVVKLRSALGLRKRKLKIGHGGTLDPMATGVLPICVGSSTKLTQFVFDGTKSYRMTSELGTETDTYDSEGTVIHTGDFAYVTCSTMKSALAGFVGEIDQVPPMYSALKRDGRPLYVLARQGKTVHREARRVLVSDLHLEEWRPPRFSLRIECGSGFYARSLAHDIGKMIGCGSYMTSLRRERVGRFEIADTASMEDLLSTSEDDVWLQFLLPPDYVLMDLNSIVLNADDATGFVHGRAIRIEGQSDVDEADTRVRVYSEDGSFLGIGSKDGSDSVLRPRIVLFQPNVKVREH